MLMRFRKPVTNLLLRLRTGGWAIEKNTVFFHEDSYRQVEFCPIENLGYLNRQNAEIKQIAQKDNVGIGFSQIYERDESPIPIYDRKIDFLQLDALLLSYGFAKKTEVYEGYGTQRRQCKNTVAYALQNALIFVYPEGGYVKDFWIANFVLKKDRAIVEQLKDSLLIIGTKYRLVLNDWNLTRAFDLSNKSEIETYFHGD